MSKVKQVEIKPEKPACRPKKYHSNNRIDQMRQIIAVKALKSSRLIGVFAGVKYSVTGRFTLHGVDLFKIVSSDGRDIFVTLGAGVLGTFKPVERLG